MERTMVGKVALNCITREKASNFLAPDKNNNKKN